MFYNLLMCHSVNDYETTFSIFFAVENVFLSPRLKRLCPSNLLLVSLPMTATAQK